MHCTEREIHNDGYGNYRKAFYDFLSEYIFEEVDKNFQKFWKTSDLQTIAEQESQRNDRNEFLRLIGGVKETELSSNLKEYMRKTDLILDEIKFPKDIAMQGLSPNAILILKNLGRVIFKSCEFNSPSTILFAEFYYEHCIFRRGARITPFPDLKDDHKYRYMYCSFQSDVEVMSSIHSKEINSNLFYECIFDEKITMLDVNINKNVFYFPEFNKDFIAGEESNNFLKFKRYYTINQISIKKCYFQLSLKLNGFNEDNIDEIKQGGHIFERKDLTISNISIIDSKFESKFEIKSRIIEDFKFENSNVEGIFDSFKSEIIEAYFYKSIFKDFAAFEQVKFGIKGNTEEKYTAVFKYTTFESFSNFREAKFYSGLDFERVNLKEQPNFLKAIVEKDNTNRETFRIIKNSFDDVGNKLEANKFFAEEMAVYKKELDDEGDKWDRLVYRANEEISDFGRSYIKPSVLLFLSLIIYTSLLSIHESFFEHYNYFLHPWVDCLSIQANEVAKNLLPFSRFLEKKSGIEFVSLLFYIWFGILIWQIVVSVKRHTQR
ncbi:hypothetical protein [Psychrobacter sp. S4(2024)]|uniref:hypothetical protein n=1 Tax=Psychrobacter sp. S4(2024) TaxID=3111913 RepID=UPI002FE00F7A